MTELRKTGDHSQATSALAGEPAPSPHIELTRAYPHDEPLLANLLHLYMYDFSEFIPLEPDEAGRFVYPHLPLYWSETQRHPFLIYVDNNPAGFAFVTREQQDAPQQPVWDMAEFFILRAHRRNNVGTQAAHAVWAQFPGAWQVRVMAANAAAGHFWRKAILSYIGADADPVEIEQNGKRWLVFRFETEHS